MVRLIDGSRVLEMMEPGYMTPTDNMIKSAFLVIVYDCMTNCVWLTCVI